ncbi:MAG TPA: CPBP family intramembrane metalloprotease [Thermoplasmatales archaeon]|nr:CPBP family intramembrane metalloprotease [Thermoplasmatales archaeon]
MRKIIAYAILGMTFILIYGSVFASIFIDVEYELNSNIILFSLFFNMIIMFLFPVIFIYLYYGGNVFERLYFRREGIGKSIFYGVITTFSFIFLIGIILYILGYEEENPLAEEIGRNLSIMHLILIPLLSSLSEETFYRGFIQMHLEKKTGFLFSLIFTSILFAIAHIEYGTFLQIVLPFFFSIFLGLLIHKFENIFAPLSAHFLYNFISLAIFLYK